MSKVTAIEWIDRILNAPSGAQLFIPVRTLDEQDKLHREVRKQLRNLAKAFPEKTVLIENAKTAQNTNGFNELYVVLKKHGGQTTTAFLKSPDGEIKREDIK